MALVSRIHLVLLDLEMVYCSDIWPTNPRTPTNRVMIPDLLTSASPTNTDLAIARYDVLLWTRSIRKRGYDLCKTLLETYIKC